MYPSDNKKHGKKSKQIKFLKNKDNPKGYPKKSV
jgi:hypothetical protein